MTGGERRREEERRREGKNILSLFLSNLSETAAHFGVSDRSQVRHKSGPFPFQNLLLFSTSLLLLWLYSFFSTLKSWSLLPNDVNELNEQTDTQPDRLYVDFSLETR